MTHLCKQPNGKFCIYCTVIDRPLFINMTYEDYVKYNVEKKVYNNFWELEDFERAETLLEYYKYLYKQDTITADDFDMSEEDFNALMAKMSDINGEYQEYNRDTGEYELPY